MILLSSHRTWSQSSFNAGLIPSTNLNLETKSKWSLNANLQSRVLFYQGGSLNQNDFNLNYVLTDLSFLISRKIGISSKFNIGYLHRFHQGTNVHRLIQQFNFLSDLRGNRFAHRIAFDQTFSSITPVIIRARYRISYEISMHGEEINNSEMYLKLSAEILNAFSSSSFAIEFRTMPSIGWFFNTKNKLELGLDHRIGNLLRGGKAQNLWATITWYKKI